MYILRVLHVIPSLGGGGSERSLCESIYHFPARIRSDVVVFQRREGDAVEELEHLGVDVTVVSQGGLLKRVEGIMLAARRLSADLIHVSVAEAELPARIAGRRLGLPVLSVLANTSYDPIRRLDPGVTRWRLMVHQVIDAISGHTCVTHFRAVSPSAGADARRNLLIRERSISVIPRGRPDAAFVPVSKEERLAARSALELDDDAFVVGSVSRREFQKALEVLIKSTAALQERGIPAVFVHAGRAGNADRAIERAIADCRTPPVVRLLGSRADVLSGVLPAFDVFAFPSRYEGLPGALMEAAGRALPIVASDIGPNRDLLGSCPTYVPVDDVAAMTEALEGVYKDPSRAQTMGLACHRWVAERHRIRDVAALEVALYERVVADHRR